MAAKNSPAKAEDQVLVITRVFDAPREVVFKAWSDPEQVKRWWGPRGYTTPVARIDFRVGGKFLNCMRSPEGVEIWSTGVYKEIVVPERIVCTDSFADADGNVVPASHYGMAGDIADEMMIAVTFEDLGGKTKMTLRHAGLPAGDHQTGANQGWNESFDKLVEELAKA